MTQPAVTDVVFATAPLQDQSKGLHGWVRFRIGSLVIDGVAVRRTRDGELTLSWPRRRDRHGRDHAVVRPLDDRSRQRLEAAVFEALRIAEEGGS